MLLIPVEKIVVEARRFRQDFPPANLARLAASIQYHGLFHPIQVKELPDGSYLLVHGERRLRACRDYLWPTGGELRHSRALCATGLMPATLSDSDDPLVLEEAEFSENEDRDPFTWQERADATARLSSIRTRQATALNKPAPTVAQISEEIKGSAEGGFHEETRRELIVSQHLGDAEVAGSKSLDEAFKLLKRREETQRYAALAESVGATFNSSFHTILQADCLTWMMAQPAGKFDIILTDPPYGIDAQDFGDAGGRLQSQTHTYDDSFASWRNLMEKCAPLWFAVARSQAHLYVCCDIDNFVELKRIIGSAGWSVHRTPIVNHKTDGNRVPWPALNGPQRRWEIILLAVKGEKPFVSIIPDIMFTKGDTNLGHGAQKPVSMYSDLLRRSARPGDEVLDTFGGTGSLLPAAHLFKCRATVIEIDPVAYGMAAQRLQRIKEGENGKG